MLWECKDCGTKLAVGLKRCPNCNRNHIDKGEETVPKTTALGWGAEGTNALEPDYLEKQEERWAGKAGSESSKKPEKRPAKRVAAGPSPAPKTEPPSKTDPKARSTAGSAGGSPSKGGDKK